MTPSSREVQVALCTSARPRSERTTSGGAETLAREGAELTQDTDDLNLQGQAQSALAEVLAAGRRHVEARAAAETALELYERKGNLAAAGAARAFLVKLDR